MYIVGMLIRHSAPGAPNEDFSRSDAFVSLNAMHVYHLRSDAFVSLNAMHVYHLLALFTSACTCTLHILPDMVNRQEQVLCCCTCIKRRCEDYVCNVSRHSLTQTDSHVLLHCSYIAPHAMLCKQLQRNRLRLKVQFCGAM